MRPVWPSGRIRDRACAPGGDDANDGSSWSLAKRTVQAGTDTAALAGGEVWVRRRHLRRNVSRCGVSRMSTAALSVQETRADINGIGRAYPSILDGRSRRKRGNGNWSRLSDQPDRWVHHPQRYRDAVRFLPLRRRDILLTTPRQRSPTTRSSANTRLCFRRRNQLIPHRPTLQSPATRSRATERRTPHMPGGAIYCGLLRSTGSPTTRLRIIRVSARLAGGGHLLHLRYNPA